MKSINKKFLRQLANTALNKKRFRTHFNLHESFSEPCQRLLNAVEPGSYIRPHRHFTDPKVECLVALQGLFLVIFFDDVGKIVEKYFLGSEQYRKNAVALIEIQPWVWHTIISLRSGSVLFEVKAGPFNPNAAKDFAEWSPCESDPGSSRSYYEYLLHSCNVDQLAAQDDQMTI